MLVKRIDLGSIPLGIYETGEDIEKGRAVVLKSGKIHKPSTKAEAESALGFATLAIDDMSGGDVVDHNTVKSGKKVIVYTLVSSDMWGTTEFVSGISDGDDICVSYESGKEGMLVKSGVTAGVDDSAPLFTAHSIGKAGSYDLLEVFVK